MLSSQQHLPLPSEIRCKSFGNLQAADAPGSHRKNKSYFRKAGSPTLTSSKSMIGKKPQSFSNLFSFASKSSSDSKQNHNWYNNEKSIDLNKHGKPSSFSSLNCLNQSPRRRTSVDKKRHPMERWGNSSIELKPEKPRRGRRSDCTKEFQRWEDNSSHEMAPDHPRISSPRRTVSKRPSKSLSSDTSHTYGSTVTDMSEMMIGKGSNHSRYSRRSSCESVDMTHEIPTSLSRMILGKESRRGSGKESRRGSGQKYASPTPVTPTRVVIGKESRRRSSQNLKDSLTRPSTKPSGIVCLGKERGRSSGTLMRAAQQRHRASLNDLALPLSIPNDFFTGSKQQNAKWDIKPAEPLISLGGGSFWD